ncbi:hypothetical protein RvY_19067-2 [Ramazzottius varieornatus]|uniref:Uncharacterized protein n=1 Tax=Ramazzottius varieornatus TaxID=947166 RepID=A0A1D1W9E7_RAMVA|nr:hypothetical protein RvY_19067-2 [Ramazzottius varieornatus]
MWRSATCFGLSLRFPHEIILDLRRLPSLWNKIVHIRLFRQIITCFGFRDRMRFTGVSRAWKIADDSRDSKKGFSVLCESVSPLKYLPESPMDHLVLHCGITDVCSAKNAAVSGKFTCFGSRQRCRNLKTFLLANPKITTLTLANCNMEDVGETNQLTIAVRCPEEDFWSMIKSIKFYNSTLTISRLAPTVSWDWTIPLPNGKKSAFLGGPLCITLRRRAFCAALQEFGCRWSYQDEQMGWLKRRLTVIRDEQKKEILGYLRTNA